MKKIKGFTIMEVLVTIGLIGLLFGSMTMVYLSTFRAYNASMDRSSTRTQLAQAFQKVVDDFQNSTGVTVCNATTMTLTLSGTKYSYTLYTSGGVTTLLKDLSTATSGSGQAIVRNIVSASSTLCAVSSGRLYTIDLVATLNNETVRLKTSVNKGFELPATSSYVQAPTYWWKFDENTGTRTYDSMGSGNNGTLPVGKAGAYPSWVTGIAGSGIYFQSGYLHKVVLDSSFTPAVGSAYTVMVWFKESALSTYTIFGTQQGSVKVGLHIRNGSTRYEYWTPGSSQPTYTACGGDTNLPAVGEWTHLAVTYDDSSKNAGYYENGVLCGLAKYIDTESGIFPWATIGFDGSNYFAGTIDDVRFYSTALTEAQVKQIYCQYGTCCSAAQFNCSGTCKNLLTDASNCGTCGTTCSGGTPTCSYGVCCATGYTSCNLTTCYNLSSDNNNCGTCFNVCTGGATCNSGLCSIMIPGGPASD
jgi:Tfp pilus assembly protein PilE